MFYAISGNIVEKDESMTVIETAGIAYEILIPRTTCQLLGGVGERATLYTRMIVRENDVFLVGFHQIEDRRLYDTLLTVSGIGLKQGLKILSDLSASEIRNAILSGSAELLSGVKGIGIKTASRIILELKDKMQKLNIGESTPVTNQEERKKLELLMAMRVFGYADFDSRKAIERLYQEMPDSTDKTTEELIKILLSRLSRPMGGK